MEGQEGWGLAIAVLPGRSGPGHQMHIGRDRISTDCSLVRSVRSPTRMTFFEIPLHSEMGVEPSPCENAQEDKRP